MTSPTTQPFSDLQVTATPNPFLSHFNLEIDTERAQTLWIYIFDLKGRSVYKQKMNGMRGKQQIRIDLEQQNSVYQVIIVGEY